LTRGVKSCSKEKKAGGPVATASALNYWRMDERGRCEKGDCVKNAKTGSGHKTPKKKKKKRKKKEKKNQKGGGGLSTINYWRGMDRKKSTGGDEAP